MINREELLFTGKYSVGRNSRPKTSCVLLVEDDQSLRRYLEILLTRAEYKVVSAVDGIEAKQVALDNHDIDIVITDAMMPNLNGYELCRFLKNTPQLSHLPVVLLSALERKDAPFETEDVDAFLCKPLSNDELIETLDNLLSRPVEKVLE
jgi:twitching motility two-component system response regulator PilH